MRRGRWRRRLILIAAIVIALVGAISVWGYMRARAMFGESETVEPGPTGQRVREAGVFANFFPTEHEGRHPAVLLLGGSEGGIGSGTNDAAKELQSHGYSVLVPSYFGAEGQPRHLELIPLEMFDAALDWLRKQPEVDPDRLVIGGVSKGAEAALLVATRHPEIRAVVAGVPSNVVWPGIKFGTLATRSSWTLGGRPLPMLPYGPFRIRMIFGDIGVVYRDGIKQLASHPDAEIPVERIKAPILLVCGEEDKLWPSCPMSRHVASRAKRHGGPPVTILAYPDAGHVAVGPPLRRSDPLFDGISFLGGTDAGNMAARSDGWPKILSFVREALGS